MMTRGARRDVRIDVGTRRAIVVHRTSIGIVIRVPMTTNWAGRLTPLAIRES
jgi:hypothetical protein